MAHSLRTLVIGLDAACEAVLERLAGEGLIPNIVDLLDRGVAATLRSQIPPWTPSAWPSIYTGVNPGKHGVFSFLDYDGYDWDVVDASALREPPLWQLLDAKGLGSVVVNAPVTHPPESFDGALVPGYVAPEGPDCHPPGLLEDLRRELGEYRVYGETADAEDPSAAYGRLVRSRAAAFAALVDRFEPALGFLQFQQTDTVFHEHPGDWDAVRGVYRATDGAVGEVLRRTDPDTVVLVSDHGIGRMDGYSFYVNEFLADHGYVEVTRDRSGMPSWVPIREQRLRGDGGGRLSGFLSWAAAGLARGGLTTRRIGALLERVGLREAAANYVPDSVVRGSSRRVDFAESVAYARARVELGVRINLAGRDPEGVVPPAEYERVRAELIDLLSGVTTPNGDPVFEDVAPAEAYFSGPETDRGVDVVTVPADFDQFLSAELRGEVFGPPGQPWDHKREALFLAAGEGVAADADLTGAHAFDVAPTVLASLDVPPGEWMDGDVLPVVEGPSPEPYSSTRARARERTGAATGDVADRLSDLGYLR